MNNRETRGKEEARITLRKVNKEEGKVEYIKLNKGEGGRETGRKCIRLENLEKRNS